MNRLKNIKPVIFIAVIIVAIVFFILIGRPWVKYDFTVGITNIEHTVNGDLILTVEYDFEDYGTITVTDNTKIIDHVTGEKIDKRDMMIGDTIRGKYKPFSDTKLSFIEFYETSEERYEAEHPEDEYQWSW